MAGIDDVPAHRIGRLGIHIQDQAVTEAMGAITDRVREHLGASD